MDLVDQEERTLTPSLEQRVILDAVENERGNILIQACAGSGKTTTLRMICSALPMNLRVLAVCFNKSTAIEFGHKLPSNVDARTIHSLGCKIIGKSLRVKFSIDNNKPQRILDEYCAGLPDFGWTKEEITSFRKCMLPLLDRVRETMTNPDDRDAVLELAEQFGFDVAESTVAHLPVLLAFNRRERSVISFSDMIDHVVHHELSLPIYDVILIDEAQDLNALQISFLMRLVAVSGARVIAVGDKRQAIYGWRGADSKSMERIKFIFECEEYQLPVCYRCSTAVIHSAQEIVGEDCIRAYQDAPEGLVLNYPPEQLSETMENLEPGDMVLCRTNAPLVSPCLEMIRSGHKAVIRGRDIRKSLFDLIEKIEKTHRGKSLSAFLNGLRAHGLVQIERLDREKKHGALMVFEDLIQTIYDVAQFCDNVQDLKKYIGDVFSEESEGVIFSTIHRAKGLEARTVVILAPELIPHPMVERLGDSASLEQETNLDYVARTRAREILLFQPLRNS